ncbi:leucine--tRNA ligase [Pseudonocardia eucalypti]|uniref:Leucine--tRNA ligase n=1 Tax=Pseudonocardia eucalypti TaxID=648755 RepID=A0ABP9PCY9_9PSEU|nr:leucyl-tRNA synthetase [Pseudonocardia eucalypti]
MSTETAETVSAGNPGNGQAAEEIPPFRYSAALAGQIERRWQDHWEAHGTFRAPNPSGPLADPALVEQRGQKVYLLDMFPYPSGSGLHVGHPLGFIGTDVLGRFLRMTGHNVLHAMGFDAFGLPAEQYAVQTGTHPRKTTEENIQRYRAQIRQLGLAHDDRRSVATTDVEFYRWTQWIFLQIYNSWYDTAAGKARPIAELRSEFESGVRTVTPAWSERDEAGRRELIDSYRLAYLAEAPVNWCPGLGTVLANEEVTADGRSERGNFPVFRRNLKQWMMRITAYSDRLVDDLDRLDWPDSIKSMQRNWIGRSEGALVRFPLRISTQSGSAWKSATSAGIEVFTTRPDTLFGATYMVLAPEHPLVDSLAPAEWPAEVDPRWTGGAATPAEAVASYRTAASRKSELDRQENKDKTGVFTGGYATNPVNGQRIPVFVADYVLMGYGTGAIMAVPGQDQRDWDFAQAFGLPIIRTVQPPADWEGEAYVGAGAAVNSANDEVSLNGLEVDEAKRTIIDWLAARGAGESVVQYKLRDWLFSRQRYWGEPFPIVHDEYGPVPLPESALPVELPEIDDYSPRSYDPDAADTQPEPPLSRNSDWVNVELDLGDGPKKYRRETNTMPQWAGSCWYPLRYLDPTNGERFVGEEVEVYWMGKDPSGHGASDPGGVDLYVGGVEHAVLHLLYARFWHKVLFDLGHLSSEEPFRRLINQGYIQAYAYTDARGSYVPAEEVVEAGDGFTWNDQPVKREYGKMGKSLRNVVTPDEMCDRYGADTFRLYEMSTGPLEVSRPWSTRDVVGSARFLQRLWRLLVDEQTGSPQVVESSEIDDDTLRLLHRTIAGVREDYTALHYNTAAAKLIELNNHLTKRFGPGAVPRSVAEPLVLLLAPMCPHIAEELWSLLGHGESLAFAAFPVADEAYLVAETAEYPIQVNGKVRSRVTVPADADREAVEAAALADEKIVELLAGGTPRKVIVVPNRLVNVVL